MQAGPICIVTSTGTMICEATSYYEHFYTRGDQASGKRVSGARVPKKFKARVAKLMDLADADAAPFTIIPRPKVPRSR